MTAGGLVFFATGSDRRFRAYDRDNGKELWSMELAERRRKACRRPMRSTAGSSSLFPVAAGTGQFAARFGGPPAPAARRRAGSGAGAHRRAAPAAAGSAQRRCRGAAGWSRGAAAVGAARWWPGGAAAVAGAYMALARRSRQIRSCQAERSRLGIEALAREADGMVRIRVQGSGL